MGHQATLKRTVPALPAMSAGNYHWPQDMPTGCPPPEATEADLTVYRLVKFNPPEPVDFDRPIDKPRRQPPEPEELCGLCALSVFADPADVPIAREFIPGFSKRLAAEGRITPDHGVIAHTPTTVNAALLQSHHDWWVPIGVDPMPAFSVVDDL